MLLRVPAPQLCAAAPLPRGAAVAKGRESWLYFTVPETPIAGAPVVVYFNRSQSGPLQCVQWGGLGG